MKLYYFNARGLAETSRILLALAGLEYEDIRYPLELMEDGTYKKEEFEADKANGKFNKSKGRLPMLETFEGQICQSKSIERYLANRYGFMGSPTKPFEAALIDSACECIRDLREKFYKLKNGGNGGKELEDYLSNGGLRDDLAALSLVLPDYSSITLSDVSLYVYITSEESIMNCAAKNPVIRKLVMKVAGRPEVIVWTQTRPKTSF